MTIEQYESAIAIFRRALTAVTPEQITSATPCASFDIGQLVDHVIGTQRMVSTALQGEPINVSNLDVARGEHAVAFDRAAADAVAELRRGDALQKVVDLPFGTFTGEQLMDLATLIDSQPSSVESSEVVAGSTAVPRVRPRRARCRQRSGLPTALMRATRRTRQPRLGLRRGKRVLEGANPPATHTADRRSCWRYIGATHLRRYRLLTVLMRPGRSPADTNPWSW